VSTGRESQEKKLVVALSQIIFLDFFVWRVAELLALVYNHPFSLVTLIANDSWVLPDREASDSGRFAQEKSLK